MIKAGIVGVSGYGGIELFHILTNHPEVEIVAISSRTYAGQKLNTVFPHLAHIDIVCDQYSPEELADMCDVVFTAVPHGGAAMEYAPPVKKRGKIFIDLSSDFRLKDKDLYESWYKVDHKVPELLSEAVYGLTELHRDEIKDAWLLATPGCYPTCSILAIYPVLQAGFIDHKGIIIDAKSGTSGAGRTLKQMLHFSELDGSFQAYAVAEHRHTPEIEQELGLAKPNTSITFVPHLVPMVRGILSVSYTTLTKTIRESELIELYRRFYQDSPFVRILDDHLPNTKYVRGSNFIDIGFKIDEKNKRLMIISAIDNVIKGTSGMAVQNLNLAHGLDETTGLNFKLMFP